MTATVSAPANVARARQLLHSAAEASKQLEENVRELVAMRAWDVLGYENFSEMWEEENGFAPPSLVRVLAVAEILRAEPMRPTSGPLDERHGLTNADVAEAVGLTNITHVTAIKRQLEHGVLPGNVALTLESVPARIAKFGSIPYEPPRRGQPRRRGAAPDDLVDESFKLRRRDADAVDDIAKTAAVPTTKSEIYRQAVAEYLARYRASRPEAAS